MRHFLIDLRRLQGIWEFIANHPEPRLDQEKMQICQHYDDIMLRSNSEWLALWANSEVAGPLPQQQLADLSFNVVQAVLAFVASVSTYYASLRSLRPLTEQEKQIGKDLSLLLAQVQEVVPLAPASEPVVR